LKATTTGTGLRYAVDNYGGMKALPPLPRPPKPPKPQSQQPQEDFYGKMTPVNQTTDFYGKMNTVKEKLAKHATAEREREKRESSQQ
jgi:hypothetical protein